MEADSWHSVDSHNSDFDFLGFDKTSQIPIWTKSEPRMNNTPAWGPAYLFAEPALSGVQTRSSATSTSTNVLTPTTRPSEILLLRGTATTTTFVTSVATSNSITTTVANSRDVVMSTTTSVMAATTGVVTTPRQTTAPPTDPVATNVCAGTAPDSPANIGDQIKRALYSEDFAHFLQINTRAALQNFEQTTIHPIKNDISKVKENVEEMKKDYDKKIEDLQRQIDNMTTNTPTPAPTSNQRPTPASTSVAKMNNVIIVGIPESNDESCLEKVRDVARKLNCDLTTFQARRIGKKINNKARPILVELSNHWEKRKLYQGRLQLRSTGQNGIYINEDLGKKEAEIFFKCRAAVKNGKILKTWTMQGTVYVKKNGINEPQPILELNEVDIL